MPNRIVFLDTSFAVALQNRDDLLHSQAIELDERLFAEGTTFVLHWGILLELGDGFARAGRRRNGLALIERCLTRKGYVVASLTDNLMQRAWQLYRDRHDKE